MRPGMTLINRLNVVATLLSFGFVAAIIIGAL
jgi:hypothetical protein